MSQLTPCPACHRHVRKTETACPFCSASISLAHLPAPQLPSSRLGRAATFAFGASLVGVTALVSCSADDSPGTAVYGGPPVPSAGAGGETSEPGGGGAGTAVYGGPPTSAGEGGQPDVVPGDGGAAGGGAGGAAGSGEGGLAGAIAIYGGPPAGSGGI